MASPSMHVTICICTMMRPELLERLLERLVRQETRGRLTYSIVVTDNDAAETARPVVEAFARRSSVEAIYTCEPRRNIALARNCAVAHAKGDFIAFIDDDEFPADDWLVTLLAACEANAAGGVLGPVRPQYEEPPPGWVVAGGFWERPEHQTGRVLHWLECRTGNVLFRRSMIAELPEPFDAKFGSGGEDVDFFMRMMKAGHTFRWCNEAPVYETVPKERCTRSYMLKRAMLRGRNTAKRAAGRAGLVMRSMVAAPAYLMLLPFALMLGQHVFMTYCIKLCDHTGRLLAMVGLNPVTER